MKLCATLQEIPITEHFVIIKFGSIHIPGDERSRSAPGHGYPEHTETTISYRTFETLSELQAWVQRLDDRELSSIRVLRAQPLEVQTQRVVKLP
jgi:hypothetical protein